MSHTIIYNSEEHAIESKIQGDFTLDTAKEIMAEFALIAKEKDCVLFLSDYSEATLKLSTMEIHGLPKIILDIFASSGLDVRRFRRALVATKDLKDYLFFETVTANRGQNTKVFYDVDEAKKWLYKK